MENTIKHSGIIAAIEDDCIRVSISQMTSCDSCRIASKCHASARNEKMVEISDSDHGHLRVGDEVVVAISDRTAGLSLLVAFGVPLVLVLLTIVAARALSWSDGAAALAALAVLPPYYIAVWALRRRIEKHVVMVIE